MHQSFADGLRDWRRRRGLSQLRLGLEADVSARHIAFLETGRSSPTPAMVVRLAEALEVPLSDRNALLAAAGFAAAYGHRDLGADEMAVYRQAMEWTLRRHDPYPAMAIDRQWRLAALNAAADRLLRPAGLSIGANLIEGLLAPGPLKAAIANWPEVAEHLATRLRTESRHAGGDRALEDAARRLQAEAGERPARRGPLPAAVPTRFRIGDVELALVSTIAQFSSAEDIALADLRIELLFPADEATRLALVAAAGDADNGSIADRASDTLGG